MSESLHKIHDNAISINRIDEINNKKYISRLFNILNKDILKIILLKLNRRDLVAAKGVCRHFRRIGLMCIYYLERIPFCAIELKPFGYIKTLDLLENDNMTDEGLKFLPLLTTLYLPCTVNITDEGLKHLKFLTTLDLSFNKKITDEGLKHLKVLKKLYLSHNEKITDEGLKHIPLLTSLNIDGNDEITNEGLKYLKCLVEIIK